MFPLRFYNFVFIYILYRSGIHSLTILCWWWCVRNNCTEDDTSHNGDYFTKSYRPNSSKICFPERYKHIGIGQFSLLFCFSLFFVLFTLFHGRCKCNHSAINIGLCGNNDDVKNKVFSEFLNYFLV
jgi:hypothetical protein